MDYASGSVGGNIVKKEDGRQISLYISYYLHVYLEGKIILMEVPKIKQGKKISEKRFRSEGKCRRPPLEEWNTKRAQGKIRKLYCTCIIALS